MRPASIVLSAFLAAAGSGASFGAEPAPPLAARLAGHTLSAFAYVPPPPGAHAGNLARIMLQAYLGPGGRALVRSWDEARDAYTPVVERPWSLEGSNTLCVGMPGNAPSRVCADVHVWGPRIAGMGVQPYVQLDGDLKPGNMIGGRR